jgi:5'-3' exonuclease
VTYLLGCKDWLWSYEYMYSPLLMDMLECIIIGGLLLEERGSVSEYESLCYVIPYKYKNLIPCNVKSVKSVKSVKDILMNEESNKEKWGFCRYLWESHIMFD